MIYTAITELIEYALINEIIEKEDKVYSTNRIIELLGLNTYEEREVNNDRFLHEILNDILDYAVKEGIIEDGIASRDLFDTKIMGALIPRPSEVINKFKALYNESPKKATDWYYKLSCDSNYIRRDRIAKDKKWVLTTDYGVMDITINLSKPEKDPKAIAAARTMKQSGTAYPKCALCKENEGYAGHLNAAPRQNHRVIPVTINDTPWMFQYSPYVYYNEHCIVFNSEHTPMAINKATFRKLLDFVVQYPHYFVGSNADLPIVGGSILTHDHFQGGNYTFAMARADVETEITFKGFEDVQAGIVKWPMSVIRLSSPSTDRIVELASVILDKWIAYSDEDSFIYAYTNGERHNTITPIARKKDDNYELDLVLRNNITTEDRPLGVYHPRPEYHHIKKENIGLIEVMGLAVLPARLKNELSELADAILNRTDLNSTPTLAIHADWAKQIIERRPELLNMKEKIDILDVLEHETGVIFSKCLEDAGVYSRDDAGKEAFLRFVSFVNN